MDTASFVVLSDTHLGYDRSLLNNADAQEFVASEISKTCNGHTDKLILNGDFLEGAVPQDASLWNSTMYVSPFTGSSSRSFLENLTKHLDVGKLVFIPGNHDWAVWRSIMYKAVPYFPVTGAFSIRTDGQDLPRASRMLDAIVGPSKDNLPQISLSYPIYFLGNDWPYCAFHHGHFLDDLVLGQASAEEYHALSLLGTNDRPGIALDDTETLKSLAEKTDTFVRSLWAPNSRARALMWAIIRRDAANLHCSGNPYLETLSGQTTKNLEWLVNVTVADSLAPFPGIKNTAWPSYLFVGHDHVGGAGRVSGPDGLPFRVINTGGWTDDGGKGIVPHGHVVIWPKGSSEPEVKFIKV